MGKSKDQLRLLRKRRVQKNDSDHSESRKVTPEIVYKTDEIILDAILYSLSQAE